MAVPWTDPVSGQRNPGPVDGSSNGGDVSVLIYVALTVAIFALLGLVQKLAERL